MTIATIYSAIANMTIAVDGTNATAYGLASMPDAIETAQLPVRLLVSVGGSTQGASIRPSTLGTLPGMQATWQVQDLMLYRPPAQGMGLEQMNAALMNYCNSYLSAIRTNALLTSGALTTDIRLEPGIYEHPPESGRQYFGVMVTLTIEEIY